MIEFLVGVDPTHLAIPAGGARTLTAIRVALARSMAPWERRATERRAEMDALIDEVRAKAGA